MPSVVAYHRPASLTEALALLAQPNRRALAGGTVVVPDARVVRDIGVELVDLQDLRLGAMTRLGDLAEADGTPELLVELARRELPSTMRYQATIGGTVAHAGADSLLVAGLLVHDAEADLVDLAGAASTVTVADLIAGLPRSLEGRLITAVRFAVDGPGPAATAWAATGRTPADDPIVGAVARRGPDGNVRLALTGVGPHPRLVAVDDPGADPAAGLDPPDDFRGSAAYRLHLVRVLAARVLARIGTNGEVTP